MINILFVCMGNICRSPTAEGVFRGLLERHQIETIFCDSAGTIGYHAGNPPDARAMQTALNRGIDLSKQRSRQLNGEDFSRFHYIIAMDGDNLRDIEARAPRDNQAVIKRLLDFAPHLNIQDVPDPYYGGDEGFERVFDMVEVAALGLLDHVKKTHF